MSMEMSMKWKKMDTGVRAAYWNATSESFEPAETLFEAFGFAKWEELSRVISIVGAGGKTSTMYDLAKEISKQGAKVLITTSTHIAKPKQYELAVTATLAEVDFEDLFRKHSNCGQEQEAFAGKPGRRQGFILAAGRQDETPGCEWKLTRPLDLGEEAVMKKLLAWFDIILIEADGSKRLPVKIPSETEPVLIAQTGFVIACMGLTAGGKPFGEACFRFATHGGWLERRNQDPIGANDMARILADERGSRKGVGPCCYRILLNQADNEKERKLAEEIVRALPKNLQQQCVRTTREHVVEDDF